MKRFLFLLVVLMSLSVVWSAPEANKPVPTAEAAQVMSLPEGFQVSLFAGEPDIVQPIAITFDDRGRLWVVECLSYPKWNENGKGNDRVTILEDTNQDGKFDKKTIFLDNGVNLSGIEYGHGGIWLCSTPNLVFVPDRNGDDKPDGPAQIVLDGWDLKAKHNVFNSLIWGPDGWLWGCNGIMSNSTIGAPGTPPEKRVPINCGVWRYHPVTKKFEPVAHGTTNPWGLDFDDYGEAFITNCVIHHLFHVIPGAHFDRMYGQDMMPHSYGLIRSIADYIHWGGGHWTSSRGNKAEHSDAGGGHAHSGCVIYLGDRFPKEYRNSLMTCNIHGSRLNRDLLQPKGSGYESLRAKDFLFANDPWFRGLAVKQGPDGSLYCTDWTDTGECHNYDVADTSNGRIYKVVYQNHHQSPGDLSKETTPELLRKAQQTENDWTTRHARRILHERVLAGQAIAFDPFATQSSTSTQLLRNIWLAGTIDSSTKWHAKGLTHSDPHVVSWTLRLLLDRGPIAEDHLQIMSQLARDSKSAKVRLALASALQKLPVDQAMMIAKNLVQRGEDVTDANLPLMVWYGVEPVVAKDPRKGHELLKLAKIPLVRENIARRLTNLNQSQLQPLFEIAASSKDASTQRDIFEGVQEGLSGVKKIAIPEAWTKNVLMFLKHSSGEVRLRAQSLGVLFDDQSVLNSLRETLKNQMMNLNDRITALRFLMRKPSPMEVPILKTLLDEKSMRVHAIRALAAFNESDTPERILKLYSQLSEAEKTDAVQTLASRSSWALALLDAIEKQTVPNKDVSVFVARQMQNLKDKTVAEKLKKVWGEIRPASQERVALTRKYKDLLSEAYLKTGDIGNGKKVFAKSCAACHKMFDEGADIGPTLTGSQRANLDYILENVLDPSAVVAREYQVHVIEMKSGRTLNGMILQENNNQITVQTANEKLVLSKADIEERVQSKVSMMPEGLFANLTNEEIRDLIVFLRQK